MKVPTVEELEPIFRKSSFTAAEISDIEAVAEMIAAVPDDRYPADMEMCLRIASGIAIGLQIAENRLRARLQGLQQWIADVKPNISIEQDEARQLCLARISELKRLLAEEREP